MVRHWVRDALEDALSDAPRLSEEACRDIRRIAEIVEGSLPYAFRSDELGRLSETVDEVATLDELSALSLEIAQAAGFQHASIFVLRLGRAAPFRQRICTSYPEPWIARYKQKSYQFVDPVMSHAAQCETPFTFADVRGTGPLVDAFWEDARAHGIGAHGICYPVSLPDAARLGISFCCASPEPVARRTIRRHASDLGMLAEQLAGAFSYLSRISQSPERVLSTVELRFLHTLLTHDDPETALKSMPAFGSVRSMQNAIKRKLGVRSVFQALGIASASGWFDDLPYDHSEVTHATLGLSGWGLIESESEAPAAESPAPFTARKD